MRYKPGHKQETHRRIVETAAKEFRAHGIDGIGIADLMSAANLTHGGFYSHFADKEDLVAQASVLAMSESLDRMLSALEQGGFPALLDLYLSEGHRDAPDMGCPLPLLSAEIARRTLVSRDAFTKKLAEIFGAIAERMPGTTDTEKAEKARFLLVALTGAVSLARAVSDPGLSNAILTSTRAHLSDLVQEKIA